MPTPTLRPLDQLRLHRDAKHLHRLGPRAVAEAFAEVGCRIGGMPAIFATLADYRRLSPKRTSQAGGERPIRGPIAEAPRWTVSAREPGWQRSP